MQGTETSAKKKRILALIWSGILVLVILPLLGTFASIFLDNLFNLPRLLEFPFNLIIGLPILAWGFFWSLWANIELYKVGKGSPIPGNEIHTKKVVNSGPYKYCRNPMIFRYIFLWVGLGILLGSIFLTFIISTIAALLLIITVKVWEEKHLEELFGEPYVGYKRSTSFIIPFWKKNKHQEAS